MSSNNTISASGFCTACRTTHALPVGNSRKYALELMQQLDKKKCIDNLPPLKDCTSPNIQYQNLNPHSPISNPRFSTDYLWSDARGQMFGVLECEDADGNPVVLKAFSCQYNGEWLVDGWVPPLFDVDAFHRLTRPVYKEIADLGEQIEAHRTKELTLRRAELSRNLMIQIHELYRLTNFAGETRRLSDVLGKQRGIPVGTGDCCAPKLLNVAALNDLTPIGLSEFYWGKESKSGERKHGEFYAACKEKCQPILGFMLCGLEPLWSAQACLRFDERGLPRVMQPRSKLRDNTAAASHRAPNGNAALQILFHNDDIVVVLKPSGLLSVPGKGPDNQDCVVSRIKEMFPGCPDHPEVHRLDMDTSGLMVLARNKGAHRELSRQFHDRETKKRYIALLDGVPDGDGGTIRLPFRLDVDNRPAQIYDPVHGKLGITHWKVLAVEDGNTRVEFIPVTGRTHQLRVHAASEHGLGTPIVGDRLYGTGTAPGQLKLHATFLSFRHPATGREMQFSSEPLF